MRILLLITLLTGCTNLNNNTTVTDRAIIGTTLTTMIVLGANIQDTKMKIKLEVELDTESEQDVELVEKLTTLVNELKEQLYYEEDE